MGNLEGSRVVNANLLRNFALGLSLGACTAALAEDSSAPNLGAQAEPPATYDAPAKWSRFQGMSALQDSSGPQDSSGLQSSSGTSNARLFQPVSSPSGRGQSPRLRLVAKSAAEDEGGAASEVIGSGRRVWEAPSARGAVPAPGAWSRGAAIGGPAVAGAEVGLMEGRPALSPWFGGFNLLFLNVENEGNVRLLYDDADPSVSRLWTSDSDPSASVGYDLSFGRYFADGRYALGVTYFQFDPSSESVMVTPGVAGDYQPAIQGWNDLSVDPSDGTNPAGVADGGADSVFNYYDSAAAFRSRRDVDFQGIELNVSNFGIMGAQRAASSGGHGLLDGFSQLGRRMGLHGGGGYGSGPQARGGAKYGFGGAAGPLKRPRHGRLQMVASHGFRWFQFRDSFGLDADVDGNTGFQSDDLFYDVDTENNLYGYQFGGRLIYCLSNRINVSINGKAGIYGNDVEYRQRLGTRSVLATYANDGDEVVRREGRETVLSTLGELDFGLGYRLCSAWTVRGGYRILGATGVATSVGSISQDFASVEPNSEVFAGDSIVLHGGYVGAEYNW